MYLDIFDKYKTGETEAVPYVMMTAYGIEQTVYLEKDVYSIQLGEALEIFIELQRKKRFYNSIVGKLFFYGRYKIIDIEYQIKYLKNLINYIEINFYE